jgi:hypothetical protein
MIRPIKAESGYVLPCVLFVSAVITTLCYLIISYFFVYQAQSAKAINNINLDLACLSAINKILNDLDTLENGDYDFAFDSINVRVALKQRGLYYEAQITARNKLDSTSVRYTIGRKPSTLFQNAFVMSHPEPRISVTGGTSITGNAAFRRYNVQTGTIYGVEQQRGNYLNGDIRNTDDIPRHPFDDSIFKNIFAGYSNVLIPDTVIGNDFFITQESIGEEFKDKKRIHVLGDMVIDVSQEKSDVGSDREYYIEGSLKITENTNYKQSSMFYSRKGIEIQGNSNIWNAVFITDSSLQVFNGTIMRDVQMIARDTIGIYGAKLLFPATVISYGDNPDENNRIIEVQNSMVNGTLMLINAMPDTIQIGGTIVIDEQSKVQGFVYSANSVEIRGDLIGCVYTYSTRYYHEPTVYINWLVGMQIDRPALDRYFILPIGIRDAGPYTILTEQWSY